MTGIDPEGKLIILGTEAFYLLTLVEPDRPDLACGLYGDALRIQVGYGSLRKIARMRGPSGEETACDQDFIATKSLTGYAIEEDARLAAVLS